MKNADTLSSTFANRTSRHTTKVCKRAVSCQHTKVKLRIISLTNNLKIKSNEQL